MFDDLIDSNVEKLRPHFQAAAGRVEGFSWMVLSKLDQIAENTKSENPFTLRRERVQRQLVAATRIELDPVPMGQEWELEVIAISAAGVLTIDNGVGFIYAHDFGDAYQGRITLEPGTQIGLTCTTSVNAYLQFECKAPRKGKRAVAGLQGPDTQAVGPYVDTQRHVAPDTGHRPIVPSGDTAAAAASG